MTPRRVGNAPGAHLGPTNSGRLDVVFRVLWAPDDDALALPLWNAGSAFNLSDIAGMLIDGGLADGTRLQDADGTHWLVRECALHQVNGSRRLVPRETNKTDRIAKFIEMEVTL